MDEGSALLHHLERRVHLWLNDVARSYEISCSQTQEEEIVLPNTRNCICIAGFKGASIEAVHRSLWELLRRYGQKREMCSYNIIDSFHTENNNFHGSTHVLLCCNWSTITCNADRQNSMTALSQCCKRAKELKAKVLLLCVNDAITEVPNTEKPNCFIQDSGLNETIAQLQENGRLLKVESVNGDVQFTNGQATSVMDWLTGVPESYMTEDPPFSIPEATLKILEYWLPNPQVFMRLTLMSLVGCLSVLLTALILIFLTKDLGVLRDVQHARTFLSEWLHRHKTAQADWHWRYNALVITALQLNNPNWCFEDIENRRGVDRLEIGLLAALSRTKCKIGKVLTTSRLAQYITSLLAVHQDPRYFHGHDLVKLLQKHLAYSAPFVSRHTYAYSTAIIALCNAGVPDIEEYKMTLVSQQNVDGSFGICIGDTAMAILALSCRGRHPQIEASIRKAEVYVSSMRHWDGSYGTVPDTSLVVQTLNGSSVYGGTIEYQQTITWLLKQLKNSWAVRENLDVMSQLLVGLSGRSLLDIPNLRSPAGKIGKSNIPENKQPGDSDGHHYISLDDPPLNAGRQKQDSQATFEDTDKRQMEGSVPHNVSGLASSEIDDAPQGNKPETVASDDQEAEGEKLVGTTEDKMLRPWGDIGALCGIGSSYNEVSVDYIFYGICKCT